MKATSTSKNVTAAFALAYVTPPFPQNCALSNCSIRFQNGTILTYPLATQVSIQTSSAPTTPYTFGRAMQSHEFCPICGVSIYIRKLSISPEHYAKYSGPQKDQKKWEGIMPINLRCFEGVEWDKIEVKKANVKDFGVKYEV
jgi:hypothetical protein